MSWKKVSRGIGQLPRGDVLIHLNIEVESTGSFLEVLKAYDEYLSKQIERMVWFCNYYQKVSEEYQIYEEARSRLCDIQDDVHTSIEAIEDRDNW